VCLLTPQTRDPRNCTDQGREYNLPKGVQKKSRDEEVLHRILSDGLVVQMRTWRELELRIAPPSARGRNIDGTREGPAEDQIRTALDTHAEQKLVLLSDPVM